MLTCTDRAELVSRPATPMLFYSEISLSIYSVISLSTILHAYLDRSWLGRLRYLVSSRRTCRPCRPPEPE